jgi:hypothetical protein
VLAHPHLELLSSDEKERWKLKVVADQLREFGCVPYSYKEVQSADGSVTSSRLVVALYERHDLTGDESVGSAAARDRR